MLPHPPCYHSLSAFNSEKAHYTLMVQGGDWNYNVSANARVRPTGKTSPYTYIYFSQRSFPVPAGETVVNNYSASGAIRFKLSITGDSFTSWGVSSIYASANPAGKDRTNSQIYSVYNSACPDGIWYMPVVPNDQIRISGSIYISGTAYDVENNSNYNYNKYYAFSYTKDIHPDEIVEIPLQIEHVAPPPAPALYSSPATHLLLRSG